MKRRRNDIAGAIAVTIAAGLASRKYPWLLPAALGKYPGDVLWAQVVYWAVCWVIPTASRRRVSALALAVCYADEFSQLYQAPWINHLRATTAGHLVLGSTFSWRDLLAYTVGVALCTAVEVIWFRIGGGRAKA